MTNADNSYKRDLLVDSKKEELNNVVEHTQIRVVKTGSGGEGGK